MSPWDVTIPLHGGRRDLSLAVGAYLAVAGVPWAAGCSAPVATVLSALVLAGLPAALRALPGPGCRLAQLRYRDGTWTVQRTDGREHAATMAPGTRCLPDLAVCRVEIDGRRSDLWVSRHSVPDDDYRRLVVALRCSQPAAGA